MTDVTREGQRPDGLGPQDAQLWQGNRRRGRGRRGGGEREEMMVPRAEFRSYYGRPVVKPAVWKGDIPAYLFLGGLAGASSMLAAGADMNGSPTLRRAGRLTAIGALTGSFVALVHDLGRPSRFANMLRVAKPTSPMSVGTWILSAYGPFAGLAAMSEAAPLLPNRGAVGLVKRVLPMAGSLSGIGAGTFAPALVTYTAVLLGDTASPAWHEAHRELPYVFAGSAAAAAGGMGMLAAPLHESAPARRLALLGAALELAAEHRMEQQMGLVAETLHDGVAGRVMRAAKICTAAGALGAAVVGRRSRVGAALSGLALLSGSACTRFGVFEAGRASAMDPKYTVVPQRERARQREQ